MVRGCPVFSLLGIPALLSEGFDLFRWLDLRLLNDDLIEIVAEGGYKFVVRDGELLSGFIIELRGIGFFNRSEYCSERSGDIEIG